MSFKLFHGAPDLLIDAWLKKTGDRLTKRQVQYQIHVVKNPYLLKIAIGLKKERSSVRAKGQKLAEKLAELQD